MGNNKKIIRDGYSTDEAKRVIDKYIDESALRLRKKLQAEWKKQSTLTNKKKLSYA
ncbi:MAG: hypothetical protein ABIJ23_03505 [Candidatus Magasanikbacteria bacterium]